MRVSPAAASGAVVAALATVVALGACGGPAGDTGAPTPPAGTQASPSAPPSATAPGTPTPPGTPTAAVPETLRFTARTIDGQPFDGATLAGKPAAFWFWAAWCPRCRAAADDVAAAHRDNAGRVNFVGVAGLGSGEDAMRDFVRERGIGGFPNLADDAGEVWRRFGVTSQEFFVLLDSAGRVVHSGALSPAELRERVAALR